MDRLWVKDLQIGQPATGLFLVVRKQASVSRADKPFLRVLLQDRTGQVDARIWERVEELSPLFEEGDRVRVEGQVASFRGKPQLTIEKIEKFEGEADPADFDYTPPSPPPARGSGDAQVAQLREELARVEDPHVRALLLSFIDDPEIAAKLARAPAAKEIHHAYSGGLVEHILSCVRLAHRLADHYPMADRDLLVAGAFLHDLGKIQELAWENGNITYTDEGRLVGHLVITAQWIAERARVIQGFPKDLENHLIHLVLAHHGRLEYGSPKVPHTIEAFLVHALDEIDSRMNQMLSQMARSPGEKWAEPQKHWERLLWKAPAPTEGGKLRGAPAKSRRKRKRREAAQPTPAAQPSRAAQPQAASAPAPSPATPAAPQREEARKAAPRATLTFKPFSELTGQKAAETEAASRAQESAVVPEATSALAPEPAAPAGSDAAPGTTPAGGSMPTPETAAPAVAVEEPAPSASEEGTRPDGISEPTSSEAEASADAPRDDQASNG